MEDLKSLIFFLFFFKKTNVSLPDDSDLTEKDNLIINSTLFNNE